MKLKNRVIVVTGGSGLLGKAFVEEIVKEGGIGIIGDINDKLGLKTVIELQEKLKTSNIIFRKLDINSKDSVNNFIAFINNKYGKIDSIVNNAYPKNANYGRKYFDVQFEDFCENVTLHLGGYFLIMQKFAEYFCNQGFGNIINISSVYGVIAPRFEIYKDTQMTTPVEYAVIKSSIIHLTKYLAKYLKGKNIRVNSISPGGIWDNQKESFVNAYKSFASSKGMLNPNDVTGALIFLLSDTSQYINGQNIIVDDGFSL